MLAMWQAAHNTDYYITKYGTKALEQLQNLIAQFALGLRRLEAEEQLQLEQEQSSADLKDYKRTLRYYRRYRLLLAKEKRLRVAAEREKRQHAAKVAELQELIATE